LAALAARFSIFSKARFSKAARFSSNFLVASLEVMSKQRCLGTGLGASMAKPAVSQNLGVVSVEDHPNPPKKTKTKCEMNQNAIKCFNHGYHLTPPCNSTGVSVSMAEYHPRS